jgi:hypothetical protein
VKGFKAHRKVGFFIAPRLFEGLTPILTPFGLSLECGEISGLGEGFRTGSSEKCGQSDLPTATNLADLDTSILL